MRGRDRMAALPSTAGGAGAARPTCPHPASVAHAASFRTSLRRASTVVSHDLVDRVDGTLGAAIAARHGEEAVQEGVLLVPGLEPGRGAEVVGRRVDGLTTR